MSATTADSARTGATVNISSPLTALLFVAAVTASLFFNGMRVEYFALAMGLLLAWVAALAWQGIAAGRSLPGGLLLSTLGIYTSWLLLTLLWNPALYLGVNYFWLLATPFLVMVAWYLLPHPDQLWRYLWPMLLVVTLALVTYALYQYYWLHDQPTATFINRNSLAAMLNLLMMIAVSQAISLPKERKLTLVFLLITMALAGLTIGLVAGRGAFLGLSLAIVVLIGWSLRCQPLARRRLWLSIAAIIAGITLANLPESTTGQNQALTQRMESLSNPYSAGSDRFVIWRQTLKMAMAKPVSGYGLGTYWQHWPQWRDPIDDSHGYWAHNDLLHLWAEGGLPATLLLLAVHFVLLAMLWRIVRNNAIEPDRKNELMALFAGLLAVAAHAMFDFNYYTLPILLVLSLMMARIARVERDFSETAGWRLPRWLRPLIPLSALATIVYFSALGTSALVFDAAKIKMSQGALQEAEQKFVLAERLWNATDIYPYTHALLKEQQLMNTPATDIAQRKAIFSEAQGLLDQAVTNDPLRPLPYFIRGRLLVTAADLAGPDWLPRAEAAFKQSLARDPRFLEGRLTLARILEVTERQKEADALIEAGMPHFYFYDDPNILTFYQMAFAARQRSGNMEGANAVMMQYNHIVKLRMQNQPH